MVWFRSNSEILKLLELKRAQAAMSGRVASPALNAAIERLAAAVAGGYL